MGTAILRTKLFIPPVRSESVQRQRLYRALDQALRRRGALVCAPAGFGKSTLLAAWARQCDCAVRWLSLDSNDNDAPRFWSHLSAALADLWDDDEDWLPSGATPSEDDLARLIDRLLDLPSPVALVLDDLHLLSNPEIHGQLVRILEHLPPQAHLIGASRYDPPWPLTRLRVSGDLVEIRARDLRFSDNETSGYFASALSVPVPEASLAVILERTEGWAAGLQMVALSLRPLLSTEGGRADDFLRGLSESRRFVLDYLTDEVLNRQRPELRRFLLCSAILDRLSAPLCNAVVGTEDGQRLLEELERANLFLIPLDSERRWYRYHHLFRDLLLKTLQAERPADLAQLHQRASVWYQAQGYTGDALTHGLAANDVERVARLVAGNALAIMGHDEMPTLLRRLDQLGPSLQEQPWLRIARAWVLTFAGELAQADAQLAACDAPSSPQSPMTPPMLGHCAAIRAYLAGMRGQMPAAADQCCRSLELLEADDAMARSFVTALWGSVLRWEGDYPTSERLSIQAIEMSRQAGLRRVVADAFCDLAALQISQGKLRAAEMTCLDALERAERCRQETGRRLPITGFVHARLSAVYRLRQQLPEALEHARRGVTMVERWGWPDGLVFGYTHLAEAEQAAGRLAEAQTTVAKAERVARGLSPFMASHVAMHAARLALRRGHMTQARHWAEDNPPGSCDALLQNTDTLLTWSAIHIASGRAHGLTLGQRHGYARRVLDLLSRIEPAVVAAGAQGTLIEMLGLEIDAHMLLGQDAEVAAALDRLLDLAEPEENIAALVSRIETLEPVLRKTLDLGAHPSLIRRILAADGHTGESPLTSLADPLTPRELAVLRLLNGPLNSCELARELFLSPNTVRSHIKRIYSKLGVHSRAEAVDRARSLGLL